jgi:hypothetical protein
VQIPGFKKTAKAEGLLLDVSVDLSAPSLKALPPLAVLPILDSSFLRILYRFFYCLFAVALLIALAPYITDSRSTLIQNLGWVSLWLITCLGLWFFYKRQCVLIPVGSLAYENGLWILWDGRIKTNYLLAGEVLCWPWLIILPLKNVTTGRKRYVLLGSDALGSADQARLRTWLRACLKPKG